MQPRSHSQRDSRRVCSCCLALSGSRVREREPRHDVLLPNGQLGSDSAIDQSIRGVRSMGANCLCNGRQNSPSDNRADIAGIISPKDKFLGKNRGLFLGCCSHLESILHDEELRKIRSRGAHSEARSCSDLEGFGGQPYVLSSHVRQRNIVACSTLSRTGCLAILTEPV
jgi:hypothetical protein